MPGAHMREGVALEHAASVAFVDGLPQSGEFFRIELLVAELERVYACAHHIFDAGGATARMPQRVTRGVKDGQASLGYQIREAGQLIVGQAVHDPNILFDARRPLD